MEREYLVRWYPKLFHMAAADSWPSIARHGLLSTQALLDLFEVEEPKRSQLLGTRRKKSTLVEHPIHGRAVIRDQGPLSPKKLAACLTDDVTVEEWLRLLNQRVFFWATTKRLDRFTKAGAYRGEDQLVITFDTERLLDRIPGSSVTLCHMNSGSTGRYAAAPRGPDTFRSIADYPPTKVAELCVADRVTNVEEIADLAEIRGSSPTRVVWCREWLSS